VHFGDVYDIPDEIGQGNHSTAFMEFLRHWFFDSRGLNNGEVDLSFLAALTPDELHTAKGLLRRNLGLRYTHIIEGCAILRDLDSVSALRTMLSVEPDLSRQLTIAGALWKLVREPSFAQYLILMKESNVPVLRQAHIHQVLWLGDERTIDLLIDLLDDEDSFVRFQALVMLNRLEFAHGLPVPERDLARQPDDYRARRLDQNLRRLLVSNLLALK
jgi:hypothetical protein